MSDKPVIGFIGVGAMGLPMTRNLLRAGYSVVAYDSHPDALHTLGNQVTVAASARDVGDKADIVLSCLPTMGAYRDTLFGETGLVHGTRLQTYVHLGTTGAALVEEAAAAFFPRVAVADAPITGGTAKAADGTLTTILSGDAHTVATLRPILESYSARIVVVGDKPGPAQVMKLVNNIASLASLAAASEAMLVGAKAGLDPRVMLEVMNNGSGQSNATLTKIPRHVLPRTFDFGGSLAISLKDSAAFMDEAEASGVPTPICRQVTEAYHRAGAEEGVDGTDMTVVIRPMERAAGFTMPKSEDH